MLTIESSLGDVADQLVVIVVGCSFDRSPSSMVAATELEESGDRLVAHVDARIALQDEDELGNDVGGAELLDPASFAGDRVQGDVTHRFDGVGEGPAEHRSGLVARVVIEEVETPPAGERVGMLQRRVLDAPDRGC